MAYDQHPTNAYRGQTSLDCQECDDGVMEVYERAASDPEAVLRCRSCGWMAHATLAAIDSGDWDAAEEA